MYNILKNTNTNEVSILDDTIIPSNEYIILGQTCDPDYIIHSTQIYPNIITAWEFRDSFTPDELIQIINAAYDGDTQCRLLLLKIQTATDGVDLNGESAISGLTYLNNIGILANGRINEIRRL